MSGKRHERGMALTETVLAMSFIMLTLYGIIETGMAAYYQVSADGATYVASRTTIQNDPDGTGGALQIAQKVANSIFQGIGKTTVSVLKPTNTTFETDVSVNAGNFGLPLSQGGQPYNPTTTSREIEASSDAGNDNAAVTFPPTDGPICLAKKVNGPAGALMDAPIAGAYTPGTLAAMGPSAANSVSGSLSITPATLAATFGAQESTAVATAASQTQLSADLTTITTEIAAIEGNPALGTAGSAPGSALGAAGTTAGPALGAAGAALTTILNTQILGMQTLPNGTTTPALSPGSVAAMLSGPSGAVVMAGQGALSSTELAALNAVVGANGSAETQASGIIGMITAIPNVQDISGVQQLLSALTDLSGAVNNVDAAEKAVNTADATATGGIDAPPMKVGGVTVPGQQVKPC